MPKEWLYFVAMLLPLVLRILVLNTSFVDWLWYQGYTEDYAIFNVLRASPHFIEFVGGWPLPVFTLTIFSYWIMDDTEKNIPTQFLLLPILYVPFTIIGKALLELSFDPSTLYTHPLIVIPWGYLYVFPAAFCIWALGKLRIVV